MKWLLIPVMLLAGGCGMAPEKQSGAKDYFFDLQGYFETESARLSALNQSVIKEVIRNNAAEKKKLKVNWKQELEIFAGSDINKAAWKDSYRTVVNGNSTSYIATEEDLKTRKIIIEKHPDGKLKHIQVHNKTENFLYSSTEQLDYYPLHGYRIEKSQTVRVIGKNHYVINTRLR